MALPLLAAVAILSRGGQATSVVPGASSDVRGPFQWTRFAWSNGDTNVNSTTYAVYVVVHPVLARALAQGWRAPSILLLTRVSVCWCVVQRHP